MVRQRLRLNGHEFEQTPEDSKGQESLACCTPRGRKESDQLDLATEQQQTPKQYQEHNLGFSAVNHFYYELAFQKPLGFWFLYKSSPSTDGRLLSTFVLSRSKTWI